MNKILLTLGIIISTILFFIAGVLIGYSSGRKNSTDPEIAQQSALKTKDRKPSESAQKDATKGKIEQAGANVINRLVMQQKLKVKSKMRIPTSPAIQKAKKYWDYTK